jgi:PAS domain S-box-containing protein
MAELYRQIRARQAAQLGLSSIEARATDLAESAMDPIIELDESQRIVLFNPAAAQVFGHRKDAVMGQRIDMLLPERFRDAHRVHIEAFARRGSTSRRMGGNALLSGLRADGEEFPIEASISQHLEAGRPRLTVILRDVTQRVRAMEELRHSKEELQALAAAAQEAREEEKSRIARELHDELGQQLTMLRMDVAWCKAHMPESAEGYAAKLDRMETLLKATVQSTRRISSDLRPLMLDDLGLVPALEWLVQNMSQRSSVRYEFSIDDPALSLPPANSTAVFRIVQEALTNIAKHASATRAEVAVRREGNSVHVRVRDGL